MSAKATDIYALTPIQKGIVFHCLQDGRPGLYCGQLLLRIVGELDQSFYRQAWQRTVDRHPVFRTLFLSDLPDQPLQVVLTNVQLPFEFYDWREDSQEERQRKISQMLESDRKKGFDLGKAPLTRITVFRLQDQNYQVIWSQHHAVLDGWSAALVLREVEIQYEALRSGKEAALPPARPFREFAEYLDRQPKHSAADFWRAHLRGFDGPSALASVEPMRRDKAERSEPFGESGLRLSPECTNALIEKARSVRVTVNTLIHAAWGLLLARYTGNDRVIFGITFAGRPPEFDGVETAVGIFINTLPLQIEIAENTYLEQFLRELHEKYFRMSEFQYSSLADVQAWAGKAGGEGLFESIVVCQDAPKADEREASAPKHEVITARETTNYPLALLVNRGESIALRAIFDGRRFEASMVERVLRHLACLLEQMADPTDRRISDLELLLDAEREQLLVGWNCTERPYGAPNVLHELFEEQVTKTPQATAVVQEKEQLSYTQLNQRANRLAHLLQRHGVRGELPIGVCLERSPEMIVVLLAILKAGGAYVALDPEYPDERLANMLGDSDARIVITQQALRRRLAFQRPELTRVLTVEQLRALAPKESDANPCRGAIGQNLAYVIYTSGSTGKPQGVLIEHRSAAAMVHWAKEVFTAEELSGMLASTSLCFDLSIFEIFVPLASGGKVIVARNALELREVAQHHTVKLVNTVPSAMTALLRTGGLPDSVKTVNLAGEFLPESLVEEIYQQAKVERVLDLYGPSEDTTYSTFSLRTVGDGANIGRPIANTQAYVLDKMMRPVPAGVPGELYLGGSGLARGYLQKPELTATRFVPNVFSSSSGGERLYRTGDVVRWRADGKLQYLGRADHQVKIRGFRIECGELETVLNRHPGIETSVVVVRDDDSGSKQLVAYCVRKAEAELDDHALRQYLQRLLPAYMTPAHIVLLPKLPLTSNGKVDRNSLPMVEDTRDRVSAGMPSVVKELIASIWAEVLDHAQIGEHENFFDLGGDSIKTMQTVSRIREAFEIDLPIRSIFTAPTFAEFTQDVESAMRAQAGRSRPVLGKIPASRTKTLSFAQRRLWFLQQLVPNSSMYNVPIVLRLQGALDRMALRRALREIQLRHEVLRTIFPASTEGPTVRVLDRECPLEFLDLRQRPRDARPAAASAAVNELASQPFDLETSPAIRSLLVRLDEAEHLFSVTLHHIVCDAWSINIFLRELEHIYNALVSGKASPLKPLSFQYTDYAAWQNQWLQGDELARQLQYWKNQLAGAPLLLDLPGANRRPAAQSYKGAMISATVPDSLRKACYALSRRESSTLFMILFAAFAVCLQEWAKKDEFLIGIDMASRHLPETEQLIGLLINQIVLRVDLAGDPTFVDLIGRVRRLCLGAYTHQDVPFDQVVGTIADARSLRYNPLFQVMFGLQRRQDERYNMKGITVTSEISPVSTSVFDLSLYVSEPEAGFDVYVRHNSDLLPRESVETLIQNFTSFLHKSTEEPEERLSELMHEVRQASALHRAREKSVRQKQMFDRLVTAAPQPVKIR